MDETSSGEVQERRKDERDMEQMSMMDRPVYDYDDEDCCYKMKISTQHMASWTCALCRTLPMKYFFLVLYLCFFLALSLFMIFVGVITGDCEDMFSTWLIVGGVLLLVGCLIIVINGFLRRYFTVDILRLFWGCLAIILIWWSFGFGRIFSGSMIIDEWEESVFTDPDCKLYLYTFPFWLSLSFFGFYILIACLFVAFYVSDDWDYWS
eukprot:GFUD01006892.1.p1 GENE.GFUD01006892.1~~GFUD01006892.1.p1  ORF type:complete len:208 (-),score=19.25 GFUD01006892.1:242-865(-)